MDDLILNPGDKGYLNICLVSLVVNYYAVSFLCSTFPGSITVGEVQVMKLLPSTIDMCVWLNNRNSTMFLVTCK